MRLSLLALAALLLPEAVHSLSTTDSIQDTDVPQSGYLPNHNIDPSKLSSFAFSWTQTYNQAEVFYAKPLVYTPSGSSTELLILVSNQNIVRVLNGLTGALITSRTLMPPFASADSQCGDVTATIGVIGTPIIDPATDIMYLYAKGYKGGVAGSGTINGEYRLYALKIPSLTDASGFPISMEGKYATNDHTRYFVGGTLLQRPGLAFIGNSIVAGFGGQCDNFNYTGMLITASKTAGVGVTNIQAMVASPGAPSPQPTDINDQSGGKAAIWQGGMGLAVDSTNSRVFFATGNGRGSGVLKGASGTPVSGKTKISTLENSLVSFSVDGGSGALTQSDWFAPSDYDSLNGGDQDLSSSGVALLDPATFSGGGVNRIAIGMAKNGKIYVLDADNMGGFKMGTGQTDGILQTIGPMSTTSSFFSGVASYPLEGGYIYFCPTSDSLYAYKFSITNGKPTFTQAGKSALTFAGKGVPTVTSLNGKAGTGIVWMSDVNQGLVAYNAIPVNGVLQPYTIPSTGRLSKFLRPAFGNSRVYTTSANKVFAIAPPGNPPPPPSTSTTKPISTSTSTSTSKPSTSTAPTTTSKTSSALSTSTKPSTSSTTKPTTSSTSTKPSTGSTTTKPTTSSTSTKPTTSSTTKPSTTSSVTMSTSKTSTSSTKTQTFPVYATPVPPTGITVTLDWNITWVRAAPDGFARPFIGINGQWPCPPIVVNYGDQVKINVYNGLGNETTAIHFHGITQNGTTFEDGPAMVTQCPIPPGETFVYQFKLSQIGTFWYHAHIGGQYIDGFRGPLIVKNPNAPYGKVDGDLTLTLTDVYHDEAPGLIHHYLSPDNSDTTGGAEPVPNAALINEAQNVKFSVAPGKTYLFRVINMGGIAAQWLQFDQHVMTIVEVDGQYVQPRNVSQLFVGVAQRYGVLVTTKADASKNYAIVASMNVAMFGLSPFPAGMKTTATGWLVYDAAKTLPAAPTLTPQAFDDSSLVPLDQKPLFTPPGKTMFLTASFGPNENDSTRAYFNGISYVPPKVPTLYTALTAPSDMVNNPTIYGTATNPTVIPFGTIVEININNHDDRGHPFHLHGHAFQLISRSSGGANFPGLDTTPTQPMRRDTVIVYAQGSATIRFVADNPGIQLFHCHTEWHVEAGLTVTFIEAPTELQAAKPYIPVSHRDVCDKHGIPRKGNAAGNSNNWLDLTGQNSNPPVNNWGALVNPPSS